MRRQIGLCLHYSHFHERHRVHSLRHRHGIANTALLPLMTRNAGYSKMLSTFSAVGNNLIGLLPLVTGKLML